MKKGVLILMGVLIVLSILASLPANACMLCGNCAALNNCYDRCKDLFVEPTTRTACYGGCIIGCMLSGQA